MARPIEYAPHNGWAGSRIPVQRDAWGCPSILVSFPPLAFVVIYNSDHPLGAGMDMDVLYYNGLAVPPLAPIEGLEQLALKFEKPIGIPSVDRDVLFAYRADRPIQVKMRKHSWMVPLRASMLLESDTLALPTRIRT
jgi:hypothetical protein